MSNLLNTIKPFFPEATGISQTYSPPSEYGIDITQPAGSPVRTPIGAVFEPDLSTQYQQVFEVSPGLFESFTHVTKAPALSGQETVTAGSIVGYVTGLTGSYAGYTPGGQKIIYDSTGPHEEFGIVNVGRGGLSSPGTFFSGAALNPVDFLSQLTPAKPQNSVVPVKQITDIPNPITAAQQGLGDITSGIGQSISNAEQAAVPVLKRGAIIAGLSLAVLVIFVLFVVSLLRKAGVQA